MRFYQITAYGAKNTAIPIQTDFSCRGRRRKTTILLTGQEENTYTFCIACSCWERALDQFRAAYMRPDLISSVSFPVELSITDFTNALYQAAADCFLKDPKIVLHYLGLGSFSPRVRPGLSDLVLPVDLQLSLSNRLDASKEIKCPGLTKLQKQLARDPAAAMEAAVYCIHARNKSSVLSPILLLSESLRDAFSSFIPRLLILEPQKQRLTAEELQQLYHVQQGAMIMVWYDRTPTIQSAEELDETLRQIAELSRIHRNDVLTIAAFLKKDRDAVSFLREALGDLPLIHLNETNSFPPPPTPTGSSTAARTIPAQKRKKRQATLPVSSGSALEKLDGLVGLAEAKQVIHQALDYGRAQKIYLQHGFRSLPLSMHMLFSGNPGTAKTTVARLVAQIFKENGLLSKGSLIEVGRSDLVGQYVGWTAKIVKDKFKEAKGSVLFIDEAYSLLDDKDGQYGDEALNTIVQEMENNRDDTLVIFAGYREPMQQFLDRNPGLRSRITFQIDFPDYTTEELGQILTKQLNDCERSISPETFAHVEQLIRQGMTRPNFGNGRFIRSMVERALLAQASRLAAQPPEYITDDDIRNLVPSDFSFSNTLPFVSDKNIPFRNRIGF